MSKIRAALAAACLLAASPAFPQGGAAPGDAYSRLSERFVSELGDPARLKAYALRPAPDTNGLSVDELMLHFSEGASDLDALGEQYASVLERIDAGMAEADAKAACGFELLSLSLVFEEFKKSPALVSGILPAGGLPGLALFAEKPAVDRFVAAARAFGAEADKRFSGRQPDIAAFVASYRAKEKLSYDDRKALIGLMSFSREAVKRHFDRALDAKDAVGKVRAFLKIYGEYLSFSAQPAEEEFAGLLSALFDRRIAGTLALSEADVKAALAVASASLSAENKYRAWVLSDKAAWADAAAAAVKGAAPLKAFYQKLDADSLNALVAADFEGAAAFAAAALDQLKRSGSAKAGELLAGLRAETGYALAAADGRLGAPAVRDLVALLDKAPAPAGGVNPYPLLRKLYDRLDPDATKAARYAIQSYPGYFALVFLRDRAAALPETALPADKATLAPALAALAARTAALVDSARPSSVQPFDGGEPGFLFANAVAHGPVAPEFAKACDSIFALRRKRAPERRDFYLPFAVFAASDPAHETLDYLRGGLPSRSLGRLFMETGRFDEVVAVLALDDAGVLVAADLPLQVLQYRMALSGRDASALVRLGSRNAELKARMDSVSEYLTAARAADSGFRPPAKELLAYIAAMRGAEGDLAAPAVNAANAEAVLDLAAAVVVLWDASIPRGRGAPVTGSYAYRLVEVVVDWVDSGAKGADADARDALEAFADWEYKGVLTKERFGEARKNAVDLVQLVDAIGLGL